METEEPTKIKKPVLLNPWTMIAGILAGIIVGIFSRKFATILQPWGELYLSFVQMCVIPIIVTAIISSIVHFLHAENILAYLKKIISIFVIGIVLCSSFGIIVGMVGKPGKNMSVESMVALGRFVASAEGGDTQYFPEKALFFQESTKAKKDQLFDFFANIIPNNIFYALTYGQVIKVVFFSVILGIAIGLVRGPAGEIILSQTYGLFKAFEKIIRWAMFALPVGMGCLLAGQIASIGKNILFALIDYILLIYLGALFIMFIDALIIWKMTKCKFTQSFMGLKETLMVSLGSRNIFLVMPFALKELHEELKLNKDVVNLILPLGFTMSPFGVMFSFSFAALFFIQLYNVPFGWEGVFIVLLGSILAAIGGTGMPGVVSLTLLNIIFEPFGIPLKPAYILLLGIGPLVGPMTVLSTVYTNCAILSIISRKHEYPTIAKK